MRNLRRNLRVNRAFPSVHPAPNTPGCSKAGAAERCLWPWMTSRPRRPALPLFWIKGPPLSTVIRKPLWRRVITWGPAALSRPKGSAPTPAVSPGITGRALFPVYLGYSHALDSRQSTAGFTLWVGRCGGGAWGKRPFTVQRDFLP